MYFFYLSPKMYLNDFIEIHSKEIYNSEKSLERKKKQKIFQKTAGILNEDRGVVTATVDWQSCSLEYVHSFLQRIQ